MHWHILPETPMHPFVANIIQDYPYDADGTQLLTLDESFSKKVASWVTLVIYSKFYWKLSTDSKNFASGKLLLGSYKCDSIKIWLSPFFAIKNIKVCRRMFMEIPLCEGHSLNIK